MIEQLKLLRVEKKILYLSIPESKTDINAIEEKDELFKDLIAIDRVISILKDEY